MFNVVCSERHALGVGGRGALGVWTVLAFGLQTHLSHQNSSSDIMILGLILLKVMWSFNPSDCYEYYISYTLLISRNVYIMADDVYEKITGIMHRFWEKDKNTKHLPYRSLR